MTTSPPLSEMKLVQIDNVDVPPFLYLQQFYEYEFSPITKSDTDEMGLYDYKKLQDSWHHNYDAYLFYLGELPVGLAVINLASQIDNDPDTRDIAEFFVMPNYRKKGIGSVMAMNLFKKYPGKWEIRQLFEADHAHQFWLRVINKYTKGKYTELICNDRIFHGYMQTFSSTV